ncbi:YbaN family protein [Rhodoplanes azumiensis]|uniref:YbaN family protein n=1 Tax=Rhodoplanes azumiensis TaxID=1897628 RepID=A0ABW5AI35_9BRAD
MTRALYFGLGCLMLALGAIGAVLPLMPTTIFLIAAAWCFARSSPRLEAWLLAHPRFGPALRAWRDQRAISRGSKLLACTGMALGFVIFWTTASPGPLVAIPVAAALVVCAAYVATRPEPRGQVRR